MLKSIPPEEKKTYVTLYRTNGYSYTLTLLAIIAEFVYVTTILDSMPVNFWMGLTVIMNIFVLFLVFTCAVKINVYSLQWAVITLAVGVYFLVRQFLIVPVFLQPYAHETILLVSNLIGFVFLITAGAISTIKAKKRKALLQKLEHICS